MRQNIIHVGTEVAVSNIAASCFSEKGGLGQTASKVEDLETRRIKTPISQPGIRGLTIEGASGRKLLVKCG
jgi:hypothetical protein